jgi:hypothetical protein
VPVSPRYRNRVREVSSRYRCHVVKHEPEFHRSRDPARIPKNRKFVAECRRAGPLGTGLNCAYDGGGGINANAHPLTSNATKSLVTASCIRTAYAACVLNTGRLGL